MEFKLSAEQEAIRRMVRDFSRQGIAPRVAEWEESEILDRGIFQQLGQLGLTGIYIPAAYGGADLDYLTGALIFEELCHDCLGMGYVTVHNMVARTIYQFGTEGQRARWVAPLAVGECLGAIGLTEPGAGSDAAAISTQAVREGGGYRVSGTKVFITSAGEADIYIIAVRTGSAKGWPGISVLVIEKGTPGFSFGKKEKKMGVRCSPIGELIFDDCRVPAANLLGEEGQGFKMVMQALDGGRINIGARSVGGAQGAFDIAFAYARQRQQFGRPIGDFQAIQFMLADMATEIEAARMLVYRAAYLMDHPDEGQVTLAAAMAKRFATDMAMRVTTDAVQVLGGYGYIQDYQVERYMRDAKEGQIVEGTNQIQRLVIYRELLKLAADQWA